MTTLNAKANAAYHALVAETERENPGDVWAGFEHERDAFEAGYEAAAQAQPVASRERMIEVLGGSELAAATVDHLLAAGVFREPQPVDREALAEALYAHDQEAMGSNGMWRECGPLRKGAYLARAAAVLAQIGGEAK